MNVFEDLIDELKEENLIEETVIETVKYPVENARPVELSTANQIYAETENASDATQDFSELSEESELYFDSEEAEAFSAMANGNLLLPSEENDYFRRRAMEEVSSLQMVERVFSAVEREQLKIIPKTYDDIPASKALHDFLQVSKTTGNPDNASAEFRLMQETESWYSALTHRDQNILPAHLRRYCETTRPALSFQALAALARFYRNSPFSEAVRSKFDLIITRLFAKDIGEMRELTFGVDKIAEQLAGLYADWASVSVYSTDDDSELTLLAMRFEDFIAEATTATDFETLVKTDFFNRVRAFKENARENFYAPVVVASAVKCNVVIGNRYVELINKENASANAAVRLEDKYGYLLDQSVSEAASKTLQLVSLLQTHDVVVDVNKIEQLKKENIKIVEETAPEIKTVKTAKLPSIFQNVFAVNKWLLILMIVTMVASFGLYAWVEFGLPQPSANSVATLEITDPETAHYVKVAKINNEILIAIAAPPWDSAAEEKKQEILHSLLDQGKQKGFRSVRLLSEEGRTVGYLASNNITNSNSK